MKPVTNSLAAIATISIAACAPVTSPGRGDRIATARLINGSGATVGSATFYPAGDGLAVNLTVKGLTPGEHGVHIHAVGTCTTPDFTSAGPHLNLAQRQHGYHNPAGYHEGDLPNLTVNADGRGVLIARLPGTVAQVGPALQDGDGSAIVVHAGPDDMKSDPTGNSGARVACGQIEFPIVLTAR